MQWKSKIKEMLRLIVLGLSSEYMTKKKELTSFRIVKEQIGIDRVNEKESIY